MELRQEIYILDEGGQMPFYFNSLESQMGDEDQNKLLTASYLTAVLQFAKAGSGNLISSFELGKLKIMLKAGQNPSLFYVYIVDKKINLKEKKIDKIITQIISEFEAKYPPEKFAQWNCCADFFGDFKPIVKKILKIK